MSYLEEFQLQISQHHYPKLFPLWEEYCANDIVDGVELVRILKAIKKSEFAEQFGKKVEDALELLKDIPDESVRDETLKLILDLQNTNSANLANVAYEYLEKKFGTQPQFQERIRLVGLKHRIQFQGAISHYELLDHMRQGNYVYHAGGWGTGEIIQVSFVREQILIEFENLSGKKEVAFEHAFKTLTPLKKDHFLARRFGNPDKLEEEAKNDGVKVIKELLRDLGPKSAAEIKDELIELVIPEKEWTKWWQLTRSKAKKDPEIGTPANLKSPFFLRTEVISHEKRLFENLGEIEELQKFIQATYSFIYDFPEVIKKPEVAKELAERIDSKSKHHSLSELDQIQIFLLLEEIASGSKKVELQQFINSCPSLEKHLQDLSITAFKKKILLLVRSLRSDWEQIFLSALFYLQQYSLRDYLFQELSTPSSIHKLKDKLAYLLEHPKEYPSAFVWYFQKIIGANSLEQSIISKAFESLLTLLHYLESQLQQKDLIRKIYTLISANRYAIVRKIMEKAWSKDVEEFLLLATKCDTFTSHDIKILHSLAEVAHPSLARKKKSKDLQADQIIWTTEEGYEKVKTRIQHIATVETVENAKDIEAARALGDLRENSEFKFALEKRTQLQAELQNLTEQLNRARIITKEDVFTDKVGIGSIVEVTTTSGQIVQYTLLGPWDADVDKNILSIKSKFAQALAGAHQGDTVHFQNEDYVINSIKSFFSCEALV